MTPQEALEFYKSFLALIPANPYKEAAECSIVALEKQIPKKPLNIESAYNGDYGDCPICKKSVSDFSDYRICHSCGQALDWSDTE